ncbi:MAG: GntR family transcriptional regulator [Firmicutes bacterium]|nr:GntR family transcriptional regulator [Bacillota bacterium]MBR2562080.1 GntR family transcriptional regulator [Eubacterium sp.]
MLDIQNHRPLRVLVYEELKHRILIGEIPPGARMMEVELAEDLGVSRTPVREAIRNLEKEGLVTIEPRRGAYASKLAMKDVIDILEVRQDLEALSASLAAARMTDEYKEKLYQINDQYRTAVETGTTADMIRCDTEFHRAIVEACDNPVLLRMITQLQEMVLRFRYLYYEDLERAKKQPAAHQFIIDALVSGDEERARKAARDHIDDLKTLVLDEDL